MPGAPVLLTRNALRAQLLAHHTATTTPAAMFRTSSA
jgi:hypothetical protein